MNNDITQNIGSKRLDWMVLSLYLGLMGIGWMSIYSVGYGNEGYNMTWSEFLLKTSVGKQTIFIGISFMLLSFMLLTDWRFWRNSAFVIYLISILLLIAVLLFGREINGAKAWFTFGGFSVQPVELTKFGTCLALSSLMSAYNADMRNLRAQINAAALIFVPVIIILLQPDTGSALVFMSFFIMLFREGYPPLPYIIGGVLATLFITSFKFDNPPVVLGLLTIANLFMVFQWKNWKNWMIFALIGGAAVSWWFLRTGQELVVLIANAVLSLGLIILHFRKGNYRLAPLMLVSLIVCCGFIYTTSFIVNDLMPKHQRERIQVWLTPDEVGLKDIAYNLTQSKLAIGSGGLQGKGYLEGTMTKLNYVPEESTDFIFCAIAEEHGFIGTASIIGLFLLLLLRITILAERQRSYFSRHFMYGVAGIIFVHVLVNMGMTMGLLPIIGIPLPFISAGGSSLMGFSLLIGALLKFDSHRETL